MEERFAALFKEKQVLREQVEQLESRQREIEVLHQAEIAALKKQVATSDQAAETAQNEMKAVAAKAEERVAAAMAAQVQAVSIAIQAGDARVEAAVKAAHLADREAYSAVMVAEYTRFFEQLDAARKSCHDIYAKALEEVYEKVYKVKK